MLNLLLLSLVMGGEWLQLLVYVNCNWYSPLYPINPLPLAFGLSQSPVSLSLSIGYSALLEYLLGVSTISCEPLLVDCCDEDWVGESFSSLLLLDSVYCRDSWTTLVFNCHHFHSSCHPCNVLNFLTCLSSVWL